MAEEAEAARVIAAKDASDATEESLENVKLELERANADLDEAGATIRELKQRFSRSKSQSDKIRDEWRRESERALNLEKQLKILEEEVSKGKADASAMHEKEIQELKEVNDTMSIQMKDVLEQLSDFERKNERQGARYDSQAKELEESKRAIADLKDRLSAAKCSSEELEEAQANLLAITAERNEARDMSLTLASDLDREKELTRALEEQLRELRSDRAVMRMPKSKCFKMK